MIYSARRNVVFFSATLALALGACGGDSDSNLSADGGLNDGQVDDANPFDANRPDAFVRLSECYAPLAPDTCTSTTPGPTDSAQVEAFVNETAVPLHCGSQGEDGTWDLKAVLDAYGDNKVFALGEAHGSNEIGLMSVRFFDALAREGRVNVLAMELPMDFDDAFQTYVDTGSSPDAEQLIDGYFATNFFGKLLPQHAHALTVDGHPIRVACVDNAYGTDVSIAAIAAMGETLTTHQSIVLETLPAPKRWSDELTETYAREVAAYVELITENQDAICTELDDATCNALKAHVNSLWVSTAEILPSTNQGEWFARREQVIYFNLTGELNDSTDRMFLHMGAYHTNKAVFTDSSGSRLAHEFPATRDHVFSLAASYGPESVTYYAGEEAPLNMPLSQTVSDALLGRTEDPFYVSTTRPTTECVANPFTTLADENFGGMVSDLYDGYLHIQQLTPESRPAASTIESFTPPATATSRGGQFAYRWARRQQREHQFRSAQRARGAAAFAH